MNRSINENTSTLQTVATVAVKSHEVEKLFASDNAQGNARLRHKKILETTYRTLEDKK